ncbi:hypothetical protein NST74_18770 [Paenibacillus sp. FSL F4-0125]|uniref:hypothetical protein n=1 Tax=Paenibacillus sp. FSL F4-0125 TaxID=2954730 RepID=UPI0030F8CDFC
MDIRIKELVNAAQETYGLDNYYLHTHELYREVSILGKTDYLLSMEWFPSHITEWKEDYNPEGTAVITIDLQSRNYKSVIFVGGKSYANGAPFQNIDLNGVIQWMEAEAGIVYGKGFHLIKEQVGEYHFAESIDGVPVSPGGRMELRFDAEGRLIFYSVYVQFPSRSLVQKENYSLTLQAVEPQAKKQLQLIEYPVYEMKQFLPIYGIEEIYITNDGTSTIPFEIISGTRAQLNIDQVIHWEQANTEPFVRTEIRLQEVVTIEQAIAREPHPDSFPITDAELFKCIAGVEAGLSQLYPDESGQWILKTLHRERGHIQATLRMNTPSNRIFQRKLLLFIDANLYKVINYMDNKPLLDTFDEFQSEGEIAVSHNEAYTKLKEWLELSPVYVYDPGQKKYVLCGKLDCNYAVKATNGDVVELGSLE